MASREGKTEAPTPKRKKEARKKGNRPKSADLSGWLTLLAATYALPMTVSATGKVVVGALERIRGLSAQPDAHALPSFLGSTLQGGLYAALPLLAVCLLVGVVTSFGQTGLSLSLHPLKPDFKRINPMQGVKRLVSKRQLWETAKQAAKGLAIAYIAKPHIEAISDKLTTNGRFELMDGVAMSVAELMSMIRSICWVVVVIAIIDYGYQRRQAMADLKMTKQEIRDEMRQSEGDPQVKGRIRSMQHALAMNRMMAAVADASVVITNPTHIAVAIRYDLGARGAPRIVAIGTGATAARIRERANAAKVPIVEAKPLARALWRACEVGDEIPVVLYEAVAKVLAFVRRLRGGVLAASALPLPRAYDVERATLDAVPARGRRRRST